MDALYGVLDDDLRGILAKYLVDSPNDIAPTTPTDTTDHSPKREYDHAAPSGLLVTPPPMLAGPPNEELPATNALRVRYQPPPPLLEAPGTYLEYDKDPTTTYSYADPIDTDCDDDVANSLALLVEARVHWREVTAGKCLQRWLGRLESRRQHLEHKERLAEAYHRHSLTGLYLKAWRWRLQQRQRGYEADHRATVANKRRVLGGPFRAWKQHTLYLRRPQKECLTLIRQEASGFLAYDAVRKWVGFWHLRTHSRELEHVSVRTLATRYLHTWIRHRTRAKSLSLVVLALQSKCGVSIVTSSPTEQEELHRRDHNSRIRKGRLAAYEGRRMPYLAARYFIQWMKYSRARWLRRQSHRQHAVAMLSYRSFLNLASVFVVRWFTFLVYRRNQRKALQLRSKTATLQLTGAFLRWIHVVGRMAAARVHCDTITNKVYLRRRVLSHWHTRCVTAQRRRYVEGAATVFRRQWDGTTYLRLPFKAWRACCQHTRMVKDNTARSLEVRKAFQQRYALSLLSRYALKNGVTAISPPLPSTPTAAPTPHTAPMAALRQPAPMIHYDPCVNTDTHTSAIKAAPLHPTTTNINIDAVRSLYSTLTPRIAELKALQEGAEGTRKALTAALAALADLEAQPVGSDDAINRTDRAVALRKEIAFYRHQQDRIRVLRVEVERIRTVVANAVHSNRGATSSR